MCESNGRLSQQQKIRQSTHFVDKTAMSGELLQVVVQDSASFFGKGADKQEHIPEPCCQRI